MPESEHRLHGIKTDGEDAVEIKSRADLRRDLLDDPHLVVLARQFRIQAVDDLLIVDQLIADRGNCGLRGHGQLDLNRATWTCAPTARDRYLPRAA